MSKSNQPPSNIDIGERLYASGITDNSPITRSAEGFTSNGDGAMGGMKDAFKGMMPEGDISALPFLRESIAIFSEEGFDSSLFKGIFGSGAFNENLFSCIDSFGPNISYHDFWQMAKKMGLKLDVSLVKETGADLGANMALFSRGSGQER